MAIKSDRQEGSPQIFDYKQALDQSSIVAVTDVKGVILHVNDNFCRTTGYDLKELLGSDHRLLNSGCHTKAFIKELWDLISAGNTWKGKIKNKRKGGDYFWLNTSIIPFLGKDGKPYQYFAISNDITEQESTSEKSEATQAYLRSSIESYNDVLIFSIDTQFNYLLFNKAFKTATAHAYGTHIKEGMSMLESITNTDDREKARLNCAVALAGEAHTTLEVYGELNKIYYETKYSPIYDGRNEIVGVTVLSANITDRKQAEEQIMELNKELEAFSYSVAHDLRAPLRSVNGYAQMLEEDYETVLNEEGKRVLGVIKSNALKMSKLIDDLLAFSKLGRKELKKAEINMNELTEAVLYDIGKAGAHNANILPYDLNNVNGDYGLLYQVMFNLLSNAIKYSSKKELPVIEITSHKTETDIIFSIKDNGAGFDMRYYDKLFGIFQRLHLQHEFEGTGVGLAIIQRIIHKHGGKVWAEGKVEEGATFFFRLPAV